MSVVAKINRKLRQKSERENFVVRKIVAFIMTRNRDENKLAASESPAKDKSDECKTEIVVMTQSTDSVEQPRQILEIIFS
mgnify:CR=1 FL=1